jgi:hypothetical protein
VTDASLYWFSSFALVGLMLAFTGQYCWLWGPSRTYCERNAGRRLASFALANTPAADATLAEIGRVMKNDVGSACRVPGG